MKLWPTLGVAFLLTAGWGTSMRLSWSLGRENARNEAQASALKSTVDTLNIISTGVQDMQQVLAQLRVENQQRNQDGEARREQLRNDIAKDECAHALPDARFTDRLRITDEMYQELERLIADAKPVSRHLTGLAISLSVNGKIFVGTGCYHGDALTVYPYTPESIIVEGDYFPAPAIHLIDNLRVNA